MKKETYDIYKDYQPKREELSAEPIRTDMYGQDSSEDLMKNAVKQAERTAQDANSLLKWMDATINNLRLVSKAFDSEGDSVASREIELNADHAEDSLRDFRNAVNSYLSAYENVAIMTGKRIRYIK